MVIRQYGCGGLSLFKLRCIYFTLIAQKANGTYKPVIIDTVVVFAAL